MSSAEREASSYSRLSVAISRTIPADVDVRESWQRVAGGVAMLCQVGDRQDEFVELRFCDAAVDADPLDSAHAETAQ